MNRFVRDSIAILTRTPNVLDAWYPDLAEEWLQARDDDQCWSPVENLAHLIDGEELDWIPRARIILEHGEARPFDPYDRDGFRRFADKSVAELLAMFREVRTSNVAALESFDLDDQKLARTGSHPALGPVTMRNLIATWTVHDLSHIRQIARTMGRRWKSEVGPWAREDFMPIFTRG